MNFKKKVLHILFGFMCGIFLVGTVNSSDTETRSQKILIGELKQLSQDFIGLFSLADQNQLVISHSQSIRRKDFSVLGSYGIGLSELSDKQKASLDRLLASTLGSAGYQRIHEIYSYKNVMYDAEIGSDNRFKDTNNLHGTRFIFTGDISTNRWGFRLVGPWCNVEVILDEKHSKKPLVTGPLMLISPFSVVTNDTKSKKNSDEVTSSTEKLVLWRSAHYARSAVDQLSFSTQKQSCLTSTNKKNDSPCPMISDIPEQKKLLKDGEKLTSISQLSVKERYFIMQFIDSLKDNWNSNVLNDKEFAINLEKTTFGWAGNPKTEYGEFYFRIQSRELLMEILQVPIKISGHVSKESLYPITFLVLRDLKSPNDYNPLLSSVSFVSTLTGSIVFNNTPDLTFFEGLIMPSESLMASSHTWLGEPVFLRGAKIHMGFYGKVLGTENFMPTVHASIDGAIKKDMIVRISIYVKDGRPWLMKHPLDFDEESNTYSSNIPLPSYMKGKTIEIIYSITKRGSPFEGIYKFKVDPK